MFSSLVPGSFTIPGRSSENVLVSTVGFATLERRITGLGYRHSWNTHTIPRGSTTSEICSNMETGDGGRLMDDTRD